MKTGEPLYIEPQEYSDRRDAQLREWGTLIDTFEARAKEAKGDAEVAAYYEKVEALRAKHDKARQQLQELKGADEEGWENLRRKVDETFTALEEAVEQTVSDIG